MNKHIQHDALNIPSFAILSKETKVNHKKLPAARALGAGWARSLITLLPKLGGTTTLELVAIEVVESTEFLAKLGAKAGWLLAGLEAKGVWFIWEFPLLANSMTSFAFSVGKSLNTITCPP